MRSPHLLIGNIIKKNSSSRREWSDMRRAYSSDKIEKTNFVKYFWFSYHHLNYLSEILSTRNIVLDSNKVPKKNSKYSHVYILEFCSVWHYCFEKMIFQKIFCLAWMKLYQSVSVVWTFKVTLNILHNKQFWRKFFLNSSDRVS